MNNDDIRSMSIDAKYEEIKGLISELEKNNIDVSVEETKLEELYKKYTDYNFDIFLDLTSIGDILHGYINQYKVINKCNELSDLLDEINNFSINSINIKVEALLSLLDKSLSINKKKDKSIKIDAYKVIYSILKSALANTEDYRLFDIIKNNDNAIIYISTLIKDNISSLRDNSFIKKLLFGLNDDIDIKKYYNFDLIFALAITENEDAYKRKIESINEVIDEYNLVVLDLEMYKEETKRLSDTKKNLDNDKLTVDAELIGRISFYSFSSLILAAAIFTCGFLCKKVATTKTYKTQIETYDSFSKETTYDEEYKKRISDDSLVTITKYTEWELDDKLDRKGDYKRTATVCDVVDYKNDLPLYDYLKIDSGYLSTGNSFTEWTDFVLEDAKYDEEKYVVTRYIQDPNIEVINTSNYWAAGPTIFGGFAFMLWIGFYIDVNFSSFRYERRFKESYKERLAGYKKRLLEAKKEYEDLTLKYNLITKLVKDEYEKLPTILKEDKKVKEKILILDKNKDMEIPLLEDKK